MQMPQINDYRTVENNELFHNCLKTCNKVWEEESLCNDTSFFVLHEKMLAKWQRKKNEKNK